MAKKIVLTDNSGNKCYPVTRDVCILSGDKTLLEYINEVLSVNNKVSPFVLINKYSMTEDGWYNNQGVFQDSNSAFQRIDYPVTPGVKYAYCKNVNKASGFAICFMKGDTLLKSVPSANTIEKIDMSLYPECTNIRISTNKALADNCFVLLDYVVGSVYADKEVDFIVSSLDSRIKEIESSLIEDFLFTNSKTWDTSANLYIDIIANVKEQKRYTIRANADTSKMQDGALYSLAVTDIDEGYYYAKTNIPFNQDVELIASKELVKFNLQIAKASFKENVDVEFIITVPNEDAIQNKIKELDSKITELESEIGDIVGQPDKSVEMSGALNMSSTFSIDFAASLPRDTNKYIIEIIEGAEKIKQRSFGCFINGVYYIENYGNLTYESDTKAVITVAESEIPITSFKVQVGTGNQLQTGNITFRVTNVSENKGLIQEVSNLKNDINNIDERVSKIEESPSGGIKNNPSLHICNSINCIVGDTIQLYYNMFVHHIGDYSLNIECSKGKNYPRYWEYTPTSNDVGNTNMKIQLLNIDGSVIEEKTINIITKNTINPSSAKNILLVGDSLYMSGQIAIELSRRLKGTTGVATSPSSLALSNFNIVGRLKNSDGSVGWEGTGGWSWSTYTNGGGMAGARLTVSGITDVRINQNSRYQIDGYTQQFYITEVNTNDGSGYIFAAFYGKGDIYNDYDLMPASGVMRKITGEGQEEINFTASQVESYQPFWNTETDSFDILSYVNNYCDGHLEILCVQLGINSIIGANPFTTDFNNTVLKEAKKFIDLIHAQLPETKIYIATLPLPSQNGGIGANYVAGNSSGSYLISSWNFKVHKVNDLYRTLAADENYNTFVSVIDVCSEMDSENNYPNSDVAVNTRNTASEKRGTNGVHPLNNGYWQISDTWFRAII